jgi:glycosyltransferase involved in cell wall biosynthesis
VSDPRSRPRLLVLGPTPPPYSGPEICTDALLKAGALTEAFEIEHIETSLRASNADRGRIDFAAVLGYLRFVRDVRRALGRKPAVVYQILGANPTSLVRDLTSIRMASRRAIPVVAQVRGGHFVRFFRDLPRSARTVILSGLGKLSRLLVEGESIRATFEGIMPLGKIEVVRHPVTDVTARFRPAQGMEARPTSILFVGHRSIAKGWLDLLRALDGLSARSCEARAGGDWRLTAIGTRVTRERNVMLPSKPATNPQAEIDELEAAFAPRLDLLGGEVVDAAKARAFAEADLFVLPSYGEGLSVAVCEALRAGLPVITTTVGALPEVVRDGVGGCLVPPGNSAALRDALGRLLGDAALRARMGKANRKAAADWFDEEHVAADYARIFLDVAARHPPL